VLSVYESTYVNALQSSDMEARIEQGRTFARMTLVSTTPTMSYDASRERMCGPRWPWQGDCRGLGRLVFRFRYFRTTTDRADRKRTCTLRLAFGSEDVENRDL
jgi:hypothetical protein